MRKPSSVEAVEEERTRKKAYFIAGMVIQAVIIALLVTVLILAIICFARDVAWNDHFSSELHNSSEALVLTDDVNFYQTQTFIKLSLADEIYRNALRSSDLPAMVLAHPEFSEISYREISMQMFFIVVIIALLVGFGGQLSLQLVVDEKKYNRDKWCLIIYSIGAVLTLFGVSLYIASQTTINNNYIQVANLIRAKALELTRLKPETAVAETLHSCQLRAIVRGQSPGLQRRLAARRICDFQYIKLITATLTVVNFMLMIILILVVAWCQRAPKQNPILRKLSALSLIIDLSPEDFRKAGFAFGNEEMNDTVFSKGKKHRHGSAGSATSSISTGSDTSYTFGNRKKLKEKFRSMREDADAGIFGTD